MTAVVVSLALIGAGTFVVAQLGDFAFELKRLTNQLDTLQTMNSKLDEMNAKLSTMNTSLQTTNAQLTQTRQILERMAADIGEMSEKIKKSRLLF